MTYLIFQVQGLVEFRWQNRVFVLLQQFHQSVCIIQPTQHGIVLLVGLWHPAITFGPLTGCRCGQNSFSDRTRTPCSAGVGLSPVQTKAGCISKKSPHHSCLEGSLDGLVAPLLGCESRRCCCVIAVTLHIWRMRVQSWLLRV